MALDLQNAPLELWNLSLDSFRAENYEIPSVFFCYFCYFCYPSVLVAAINAVTLLIRVPSPRFCKTHRNSLSFTLKKQPFSQWFQGHSRSIQAISDNEHWHSLTRLTTSLNPMVSHQLLKTALFGCPPHFQSNRIISNICWYSSYLISSVLVDPSLPKNSEREIYIYIIESPPAPGNTPNAIPPQPPPATTTLTGVASHLPPSMLYLHTGLVPPMHYIGGYLYAVFTTA